MQDPTDASWLVETFPVGTLNRYQFVIIFARHRGKWLFVRHQRRQTFELPGGHVDPGETPLQAAKRELWEETGAVDFTIVPLLDYTVDTGLWASQSQIFIAEVSRLEALPPYEIAEVLESIDLPAAQTYPEMAPLFHRIMQSEAWVTNTTSAGGVNPDKPGDDTEPSKVDPAPDVPLCVRCGRPVKVSKDHYEVFERMHWLCFHLEFEHGDYDPDEPCSDPGCPWNRIPGVARVTVESLLEDHHATSDSPVSPE